MQRYIKIVFYIIQNNIIFVFSKIQKYIKIVFYKIQNNII